MPTPSVMNTQSMKHRHQNKTKRAAGRSTLKRTSLFVLFVVCHHGSTHVTGLRALPVGCDKEPRAEDEGRAARPV